MTLILHLAIAFSSIIFTTYILFRPSRAGLRVSWGLIAATLLSGTYLVVSTHSGMLSACVSGLLYATLAATGTITAAKRLEQAHNK